MAHVAATFPGVFSAPAWHQTRDGCIPHRALWAWFAMIDAVDARTELRMMAATALAYHGGDEAPAKMEDVVDRIAPA